eukprot:3220482-Amphidinium_carterae.1
MQSALKNVPTRPCSAILNGPCKEVASIHACAERLALHDGSAGAILLHMLEKNQRHVMQGTPPVVTDYYASSISKAKASARARVE